MRRKHLALLRAIGSVIDLSPGSSRMAIRRPDGLASALRQDEAAIRGDFSMIIATAKPEPENQVFPQPVSEPGFYN